MPPFIQCRQPPNDDWIVFDLAVASTIYVRQPPDFDWLPFTVGGGGGGVPPGINPGDILVWSGAAWVPLPFPIPGGTIDGQLLQWWGAAWNARTTDEVVIPPALLTPDAGAGLNAIVATEMAGLGRRIVIPPMSLLFSTQWIMNTACSGARILFAEGCILTRATAGTNPLLAMRDDDEASSAHVYTLAGNVSKGVWSIILTSVVGIVAGDWLRLGPGGQPAVSVFYGRFSLYQVLSVVGNIVNLKTPTLDDFQTIYAQVLRIQPPRNIDIDFGKALLTGITPGVAREITIASCIDCKIHNARFNVSSGGLHAYAISLSYAPTSCWVEDIEVINNTISAGVCNGWLLLEGGQYSGFRRIYLDGPNLEIELGYDLLVEDVNVVSIDPGNAPLLMRDAQTAIIRRSKFVSLTSDGSRLDSDYTDTHWTLEDVTCISAPISGKKGLNAGTLRTHWIMRRCKFQGYNHGIDVLKAQNAQDQSIEATDVTAITTSGANAWSVRSPEPETAYLLNCVGQSLSVGSGIGYGGPGVLINFRLVDVAIGVGVGGGTKIIVRGLSRNSTCNPYWFLVANIIRLEDVSLDIAGGNYALVTWDVTNLVDLIRTSFSGAGNGIFPNTRSMHVRIDGVSSITTAVVVAPGVAPQWSRGNAAPYSAGILTLTGVVPVVVPFIELKGGDTVKLTLLVRDAVNYGGVPNITLTPGAGFSVTGLALDTSTYQWELS